MERCVKHRYLRHRWHQGGDGVNAGHIGWIVEGSNVVALLDHILNLVSDEHTLAELLSSVHHAVTHSVDFIIALDATFHWIGENVKNSLNCSVVVHETKLENGL